MLLDATERRLDLVLFWSLDRFSREGVLETLQHLHRLTSHGIEWWSFKEEYLRSVGVFRDAVLSILATIVKQERVRMSERVVAGLDRARSQGKRLGRPPLISDRQKVFDLRQEGMPQWSIGKLLGISKSSVGRILEGYAAL
jgi:DNA invertase Pin-like site-specific DNA recombinase